MRFPLPRAIVSLVESVPPWLAIAAVFCLAPAASLASDEAEAAPRQPSALALSTDQRWLYVATRASGEVYVVDLRERAVAARSRVGQGLSDLVRLDAHRLAAVDEASHELVLLSADGPAVSVVERLPVSHTPVRVAATADGARCFVSSLWSRRLTEVATPADAPAAVSRVLDLPFAPRNLLLARDDSRLIVASAFAGKLGVVDTASCELLHARAFPSHNIRGLAIGARGDMLLVSHQMLNELAHTVRNDVHWGLLMSNDLRWLPLDAVLDASLDLYDKAHMHPLGDAGRAAGDPADVAVAADGLAVVALAGVGELAIGRENDFSLERISVGGYPIGLQVLDDGNTAVVASRFDDAVSVVDLAARDSQTISLGPTRPLTQIERGERLFYDPRLSHDAWMSCHSCHTDGHANGLLNDNFTDASFGAPKRVLSLLGAVDTAPYAWNASSETLEGQIEKSIRVTMQGGDVDTADVAAIAAFVRQLEPPPSLSEARGQRSPEMEAAGRRVFEQRRCGRCHREPEFTTPGAYDVGLVDRQGNRRFNPPSLRGVSQRGPYFHDGSAETLDDVFEVAGHQLEEPLAEQQRRALVAYLESL